MPVDLVHIPSINFHTNLLLPGSRDLTAKLKSTEILSDCLDFECAASYDSVFSWPAAIGKGTRMIQTQINHTRAQTLFVRDIFIYC